MGKKPRIKDGPWWKDGLIEQWQNEYNQVRPHSSLGYRPPAPEARIPGTLTKEVVYSMGAGQVSELKREISH